MGPWSVIAVSELSEYIGGTCASSIVSSADDALDMSVEREVRGVGAVYDMCVCSSGCVKGYGVSGSVERVCVWVTVVWVGSLGQGLG